MLDKMLNIRGTLTSLATPLVMGILNITPDSFYAGSRKQTETAIEDRIREILSEGGDWSDIGVYSSRPDAAESASPGNARSLRRRPPAAPPSGASRGKRPTESSSRPKSPPCRSSRPFWASRQSRRSDRRSRWRCASRG